jgi:hypothetical protein
MSCMACVLAVQHHLPSRSPLAVRLLTCMPASQHPQVLTYDLVAHHAATAGCLAQKKDKIERSVMGE